MSVSTGASHPVKVPGIYRVEAMVPATANAPLDIDITPETVYISGPMRGIEDFNFPAFHEAAATLRKAGYRVLNPAENFDGDTTRRAEEYMRVDIEDVLQADFVVVLPGWEKSVGAAVELRVAAAIGTPVYDYESRGDRAPIDLSWLLTPAGKREADPTKKSDQETVLQTANRIVHGSRQKDYGHPYEDFSKTAGFWSVLFGVTVKPWQVATAMMLLKISRLMKTPTHYDSIIDIAGYDATYEMVIERAQELGEIK